MTVPEFYGVQTSSLEVSRAVSISSGGAKRGFRLPVGRVCVPADRSCGGAGRPCDKPTHQLTQAIRLLPKATLVSVACLLALAAYFAVGGDQARDELLQAKTERRIEPKGWLQ